MGGTARNISGMQRLGSSLLVFVGALLAAAAPTPTPPADAPITVTGARLSDLAAAVNACKAAPCPPRVDIIASGRYAEALVRAGSYMSARDVLRAAVGRNKYAAAQDPEAVSQLYFALSVVSAHEGDQNEHALAVHDSAQVLRDAYPADSPQVLIADLGSADLKLRTGDTRGAIDSYRAVARRAAAAGQPGIAAAADLRRAGALHVLGDRRASFAVLGDVASLQAPELVQFRRAALAMTALLARKDGDTASTSRATAELQAMAPGTMPYLLWEPAAPTPTDPSPADPVGLTQDVTTRSGDLMRIGWADIGFWIRPDGSVEGAAVLRTSRTASWAPAVAQMIAQRRYTAFVASAPDGEYRTERYTLTADYDVPKGSLIRRRLRNPRLERLDIG
jgi:hypothetical protein